MKYINNLVGSLSLIRYHKNPNKVDVAENYSLKDIDMPLKILNGADEEVKDIITNKAIANKKAVNYSA
jgi:hypothetical protein